ncbi:MULTISPECIES: VOC family protein [Roseobacteraceae]|uniref:Glyoxalase/bleomycin resistance protein/Dioxygenase superfamily protein n=1 Tax=Pseudosulfitobacter pseudonitzschiae TaxID=1402135 RepID=A0A221K7S4_9RHOB|nr:MULTISPECIES: VOC family protein [Roseobacteraceae]ASM75025.1 glyoxalase/bleomycin resistance protein/Dioxygenase superfamily protein [Pseudosulfitobacter pseudonitzschiae]
MSKNIINHVEFPVADAERSRHFYEAVLKPLGLSLVRSIEPTRTAHGGARHGFGRNGYPSLWVHEQKEARCPIHVALTADTHDGVRAFHVAALANGGTENGGPGIRERYHARYYAAYVLDPDGNNIEAVCQTE